MAWDVKATADAVLSVAPGEAEMGAVSQVLDGMMQSLKTLDPWLLGFIVFLIVVSALLWFNRRAGLSSESKASLIKLATENWQLTLLGLSAFVLSLAGGYTTWDGMRNFTGEPILSLMFTFGIHGVMLIVAWLIGESFASGMNSAARGGRARVTAPLIVLSIVGAVLIACATAVYQATHGIGGDAWIQTLAIAGVALLGLSLIVMMRNSDVVAPYAQALKIIAKNSVLWVMFLACMATSVFFSFDSRFNVVFPADERKRVADLRAQNQVTGILADIDATVRNRRLEQSKALFETKNWQAYDTQLANLAGAAQGAQPAIERYFVEQMEERRRGIAQQQERIATAMSGQAGLASRKLSLTDELSRAKAERPSLAAEYAEKKGDLDGKQKAVDAKRIEALAEDRGVEGTGKQGRGPAYRERVAELAKMQDEYKINEERTKDAQRRLNVVESRASQVERELSLIDGELAKLKGESQTAEQRIRAAQESAASVDGPRVDPARALLAFENARTDFRQAPAVERLAELQQLCTQLLGAMTAAPTTKERVRNIDCDPKQAAEAASVVFALNAGSQAFARNCAGGDRLAAYGNADALFGFARKCLADSGLPSRDTDSLRTKISFTELTRDDRAHRFVVSWNAFQDGNRLAYLALAIAIGIDSLIFMTGLFGANALRSPLSDVPSGKSRTAQQLEAIIDTALLPHKLEAARAVLNAMHPITAVDGFVAEVEVLPDDPNSGDIRRVLNAGATIGAVRSGAAGRSYQVRGELFEYLSIVAKREFEGNAQNLNMAELERIVTVALLPDVGRAVDSVLQHLHPIDETNGFTAEVFLGEIERELQRPVRSVLNAGATLRVVQRDKQDFSRYYIHADLYKTLARIRGRLLTTTAPVQIAGPGGSRQGGDLTPQVPRLTTEHAAPVKALAKPDGAPAKRSAAIFRLRQKAKKSDDAVRDDYRTNLLRDIRLAHAWTEIDVPDGANSIAGAVSALEELERSSPRLGALVRDREQQLRARLDGAYSTLWGQAPANQQLHLEEVKDGLTEALPALFLTTNGPYQDLVQRVVRELEKKAAPDDGIDADDQLVLDQLREQVSELGSNPRMTAGDWDRIAQMLRGYQEPSAAADRAEASGPTLH